MKRMLSLAMLGSIKLVIDEVSRSSVDATQVCGREF